MRVLSQVGSSLKRFLPGAAEPQHSAQTVHYNCICDEEVPLRCANSGCSRRIDPGTDMMVAPDGSVLCSESCAVAIAGAVG